MAGKKGSGPSNRGMMEAIVLLALIGVVALEMYLVFKGWWFVFNAWCKRNPVTPILLIIGLLMGPIAVFLLMKSTGKRMGDEAEEIGRGMRR